MAPFESPLIRLSLRGILVLAGLSWSAAVRETPSAAIADAKVQRQAPVAPARPALPMAAMERPGNPVIRATDGVAAAANPAEDAPLVADSGQLWRQWLRFAERESYQQMPILNAALAESLREGGGDTVYAEIGLLLEDDGLAYSVRAQLVELLGEIATTEALDLLLATAGRGMDNPLYAPALNAISQIGDNHWGGRFHEELSPQLEQSWAALGRDDRPLLVAVTQAIVGIGSPGGVNLLLSTLASNPDSGPNKDDVRIKQVMVYREAPKISNPAAVPVLQDVLDNTGATLSGSPGVVTGTPPVTSPAVPLAPPVVAPADNPAPTPVTAAVELPLAVEIAPAVSPSPSSGNAEITTAPSAANSGPSPEPAPPQVPAVANGPTPANDRKASGPELARLPADQAITPSQSGASRIGLAKAPVTPAPGVPRTLGTANVRTPVEEVAAAALKNINGEADPGGGDPFADETTLMMAPAGTSVILGGVPAKLIPPTNRDISVQPAVPPDAK